MLTRIGHKMGLIRREMLFIGAKVSSIDPEVTAETT